MGFQDLHLKLIKAFRVIGLFGRDSQRSKYENARKQSSYRSISHGFCVLEDRSLMFGVDESDSDAIVVQREQVQELDVSMFSVSDSQMGDRVTKYLNSHLFDRKLKGNEIKRRSKETIRKAYNSSKRNLVGATHNEGDQDGGSTSVIVINGQKVVAAETGGYKTVVCRDGIAHQISKPNNPMVRKSLSLNNILGTLRKILRGRGRKCCSQPTVSVEKIDYETEFLILASDGIWEVMKNQEAVNLIRHIDDPQEAAECLAKEALTRFTKSNISCLIVRFY